MPARSMRTGLRATCIMACATVVAGTSAAVAENPFYQGKRLTVLVNYAPGGPADVEARLFARYIGRHIPGQPTVIVQNMDGAGGLVGTSYIGEVAPRDGTVMGYLSGAAWRYVNDPGRHRVDFKTYEFIAHEPGTSVYYMRTDTPPGMKAPSDIVNAKGLVAGGLGPQNAKDLRIRLTLDLLGVPYKYVTGYVSSPPARLALQRGEINFYSESAPGYRAVVHPGIVKSGVAIPVYYDPAYQAGVLGRAKSMDGLSIPTFLELYRQINSRDPDGPLWEAYQTVLAIIGEMQLVLVMPPGAPQGGVDALRAAVAAHADDKDYLAEADKTIGFTPEWQSSPDTNTRVRTMLAVRPETKVFISDYVKNANK